MYPVENALKQRKGLKKPSKTPSQGTRKLFLVKIPPPVWRVWMKFGSSKSMIRGKERKLAWELLQKNIVMDGDIMIDRRTGEALDPRADSRYWKDKI